jgi:hypothetical protein
MYGVAGDPEAGLGLAKKALELAWAAGGPTDIAFCLMSLAGALADTEPVEARRLLEEALAVRESPTIDSFSVAMAAALAARMGDWPLTLHLADRAIRQLQWAGMRPWLAGVLYVVARALVDTDIDAAARLQSAARHLARQAAAGQTPVSGRPSPASPPVAPLGSSPVTDLRHQTSALLHDALDEGRLRQLRVEGEAMDSDQAATYALEAIRRARQAMAN